MNKKFFSIFIFIILQTFLLAQTYIKAENGYIPKDFDFGVVSLSKQNKVYLGDCFSKSLITSEELQSYKWISSYGMSYQKKIFNGIELDINDNQTNEDLMVFIISISDESWATSRGAHVGMNIEEVKKLYGPPSSDFEGFLFYYNDDFDELEICFYYDKKGIIQRIVLSMGT